MRRGGASPKGTGSTNCSFFAGCRWRRSALFSSIAQAWGGAEPRPYGQNHAPPQPTTPYINAATCHGAPSRRALRSPVLPQPRQRANGRFMKRPYKENRCRHDCTVGAIHESPAAPVTIPTQAGWMVSGNNIPPAFPLGQVPPHGANAAVKQTRGALPDAAVCRIIIYVSTPRVENFTRSSSGSYPPGCRWGRSPRR